MRISIRYKFIIGLLFIFCVGFNLISFITGNIIVQNNKDVIKNELLNNGRDSVFFIKQYLKLNSIEETVEGFRKKTEDIALALSLKLDDRVIIYSKSGDFLFDTAYEKGNSIIYDNNDENVMGKKEDLKLAKKGTSSYSILKLKNKYIICFSNPIYINKKIVGIVRYTRDYSNIFKSGEYLLSLIKKSILIIFAIIFLFIVILSNSITIPIIKLSKVSNEISKGNYDFALKIKSKDEIGELTKSFINMKDCIKKQITTIEKDRDKLKTLESHRKTFFDNATHEMKTPLTIISGYTQIISQKGFDDKDFFYKGIKKIKYESNKMHNMILKLLDISKLESNIEVEYENINISEIVNRVCEDMTIKSKKYYINIDKKIEEDLYILGNKEEISRVFINIIDNSIKYGNVKSEIKVKVKSKDSRCYITVKDRGIGIPQDKIDQIFKPFYRVDKQTSRENGSSGLGLSIVKNIVKNHGGEIYIESEENVGTNVNIIIPLNFL